MQLTIPFPNLEPLPILYKKGKGIIQFLDDPYCPLEKLGLRQNVIYSRQHDDTDGLPLQNLLIKIDSKNNVNVKLEFKYPTDWITFNAPENGGGKYYTHRALMVVATAINLDNKFGRLDTLKKNPQTSFKGLLDNFYKLPSLPNVHTGTFYEIDADSLNNELKINDSLVLSIGYGSASGDVFVSDGIFSMNSLRFRNLIGGGRSLRTHQALYLLAEAIYRDNNRIAIGSLENSK